MNAIAFSLIISLTAPFTGPVSLFFGNAYAQVGFNETSPADSTGTDGGQGTAGPGAGGQAGGQSGSGGQSGQSGGLTTRGVADSVVANSTVNAAAHAVGLSNTAPKSNTAVGINAAGNAVSLGLAIAGVPTPITIVVGIVIAVIAAIVGAFSEPPAPPAEESPDDISAVPGTAGPGGDGGCFKADTFVAASVNPDGSFSYRRISEFQTGDAVLGAIFDAKGMPVLVGSEVRKPLRHEARSYFFAKLSTQEGAVVEATTNHVFITKADNSGLRLEKIRPGDPVVAASPVSKWDTVIKIEPQSEENVPVFNIETGTDNYLVSQDGIRWVLVHNGGGK